MKSRVALIVACCLAMTACGSLRMPNVWPFHKKAKPAPEAVNELTLLNADGTPAAFPQYWQRNTLVIDLSGVSGSGSLAARLPEETTWPVRMAVRVRPGSVQQLEIQGEERNVLPVSTEGSLPLDLVLAPSVYTPATAAIYISWGAMPVFAAAPVTPVTSEFVSPTEVPKAIAAPEAAEPAAGASDIVAPAEVTPAQPSPGS